MKKKAKENKTKQKKTMSIYMKTGLILLSLFMFCYVMYNAS